MWVPCFFLCIIVPMVSHGLLLQNPSSGLTSQHGKVGPPCFLPFCFLARIGFEDALLFLGPPCSMFIFLTSSQHQRHKYGPMGDPRDRTSQLANAIAANAVPCIQQCPCIFEKFQVPKGSLIFFDCVWDVGDGLGCPCCPGNLLPPDQSSPKSFHCLGTAQGIVDVQTPFCEVPFWRFRVCEGEHAHVFLRILVQVRRCTKSGYSGFASVCFWWTWDMFFLLEISRSCIPFKTNKPFPPRIT